MLFHEQYDSMGNPVYFECRDCGFRSQSLGTTHAHIERHRGYTRFNIQLPFGKSSPANVPRLMERTRVVRVDETREIELSEVDGL